MTRINVVPPQELCDQHLLAEHRELTRIPNGLARGRFRVQEDAPADYCLGAGHLRFFFRRLLFLKKRYERLHAECLARGFRVSYRWPEKGLEVAEWWQDYRPSCAALRLNRERLAQRRPAQARFTPARPEALPSPFTE